MTSDFSFGGNAPTRPRGSPRSRWPTALSTSVAGVAMMIVVIAAALVPVASAAPVDLIVVDVVAVADGYRASKLRGAKVVNPQNENARKPRYSVPFFLHPNPDVVLDPLDSCITPDNPRRYDRRERQPLAMQRPKRCPELRLEIPIRPHSPQEWRQSLRIAQCA